mmetsp:Transcript_26003/g.72832  ORF Transcript_26003/g.72832 Transcript_26003/m.72832 type:complete len:214 (+) Transcript_26003:510-1151(+)
MDQGQTHVSGMHAGTITHMAPEVLTSGRLSKAADVYSYGILLYEMLTGLKAFRGVPVHKLMDNVCNQAQRPLFPPGAPPLITKLAKRCWDSSLEARPEFSDIATELAELQLLHDEGKLMGAVASAAALRERRTRSNNKAGATALPIPEAEELSGSMFVTDAPPGALAVPVGGTGDQQQQGKQQAVRQAQWQATPMPVLQEAMEMSGSFFFTTE